MAVTYRISELAADLAVTTRTIRFYEEQGLIAPSRRGHERIYTPYERRLLRIALTAKQLGMPLAECRDLLALYQTDDAHATNEHLHQQRERLQRYQQFLDEQQRAIAVLNEALGEINARFQRQCDSRLAKAESLPSGEQQPSLFQSPLQEGHPADRRAAPLSSDADATLPNDNARRAEDSSPVPQPVQPALLDTDDLFAGADHHETTASSHSIDATTRQKKDETAAEVNVEHDGQLGFQL